MLDIVRERMEAFGGGPEYDLRDLQQGLRRAAADDRIEARVSRVPFQIVTTNGELESCRLRRAMYACPGRVVASSASVGSGASGGMGGAEMRNGVVSLSTNSLVPNYELIRMFLFPSICSIF